MKKSVIWLCVIFFVCFVLSLGTACIAEANKVDFDGTEGLVQGTLFEQMNDNDAFQQKDLKKLCLSATIAAIHMEIDRHQRWIEFRNQQGNQQGVTELQESLTELKADLHKYLVMDAKDYIFPGKVEAVAWVGDKPEKDAILYVEGISKSGPWYHLAGIMGDDYAMLQPNTKYHMNLYTVYPRSYGGMNSAYVCIIEVDGPEACLANTGRCNKEMAQQQSQGKRIVGEVFLSKYRGPFDDLVECENYQVYLLKDIKSGSKGELILDSKQSNFDFNLSEEKLKEYSYIEFSSAYGNKTIKLNEIKDDRLQVILERGVILKKPAIYLYPLQKSQISIIHNFKGKILNTYPTYTDNWTVIAEPNGNLLNVKDNRYYKYLFWDGVYSFSNEHYQFKSGFYVKKEDYVSFLQSKLAIIGLNGNEINDFIVYWLPMMSNFKNCFIHFRINDNIDESSVLETKPKAETTIRVFVEFSGIDNIDNAPKLPEQNLPTFIRKGFTLVEWGGTEFGNCKLE